MNTVADALERLQRSRERCLLALAAHSRSEDAGWWASLVRGAGRTAWWPVAAAVWRAYRRPGAQPAPSTTPPNNRASAAENPRHAPGRVLGVVALACLAVGAYALMKTVWHERRGRSGTDQDAARH